MERKLLFLLLFCIATIVNAKSEPIITLNVEPDGSERTLEFEVSTPNTKLFIDWGDGTLIETDVIQMPDPYANATVVVGIPKGEGLIKIYGENIVYFGCTSKVGEAQVTAVDLTKATELTELYVNTNKLSTLDISKNRKLQKLYCYSNPLKSINLSENIALTYINCNDIETESLDISKCIDLETIYCNNNKLKALDISKNTKLKSLYCLNNQLKSINFSNNANLDYISVNNNLLTSIDVTPCTALRYLYCMGNQISEIKVGNIGKTLNCSKNKLTFATLPATAMGSYTYAPQEVLSIAEEIAINKELDLSAQNNIKGITDKEQKTAYTWKTADNEKILEAGKDYTENNGKFTFLTLQPQPVYCEMTSDAFPKFSSVNVFKTTPITISNAIVKEPIITLNVEVNGMERTLDFEVSTPDTKLSIDWGDGVLVETDVIQMPDPYANATGVIGIPKGEGLIKIYGENIVYFGCVSKVDEAQVTAIDLTKATDLTELYVNTNKLSILDISKNTKLQKLYCHTNPLKFIDLSQNVTLTYLNCNEIEAENLDISKCTALETLYCNNNQLKALNISQNIKLKNLYCVNNQLESIDFSNNINLDYISVNNNLLTSIDVTPCTALRYLLCMGNQIAEIKAGIIGKTLNCSKNKLTFETLPATAISGYTYAPQEALIIAEEITTNKELDLSAQNNIKGITDKEQNTVYTWKTTDNEKILEVGKDYTENDGKFTFLTPQIQPVYCEMRSDAFPKFSGVNVFKTTPITIQKGTGVQNNSQDDIIVTAQMGKVYIGGLQIADNIQIYTIIGEKVIETKANNDAMTFELAGNNYIILINGKAHKVVVL